MPHRARIFCRKTGMFRSLPAPYTAEFAEHGRTFLVEKSFGSRKAAAIPKEIVRGKSGPMLATNVAENRGRSRRSNPRHAFRIEWRRSFVASRGACIVVGFRRHTGRAHARYAVAASAGRRVSERIRIAALQRASEPQV